MTNIQRNHLKEVEKELNFYYNESAKTLGLKGIDYSQHQSYAVKQDHSLMAAVPEEQFEEEQRANLTNYEMIHTVLTNLSEDQQRVLTAIFDNKFKKLYPKLIINLYGKKTGAYIFAACLTELANFYQIPESFSPGQRQLNAVITLAQNTMDKKLSRDEYKFAFIIRDQGTKIYNDHLNLFLSMKKQMFRWDHTKLIWVKKFIYKQQTGE